MSLSRDSSIYKRIASVFLLALALALCSGIALSQEPDAAGSDDVAVFIFDDVGDFSLAHAEAVSFVDYYHYGALTIPPLSADYELVVEDSSGSVLITKSLADSEALLYASVAGCARLKVTRAGSVVFDRAFTFCDNDRVCEPCISAGCSVSENILTCADCSSGGSDSYCDEIKDGICDPDCNRSWNDPDCGLLCSGLRGSICSAGEQCVGGSMVSSSDSGVCCVGGRCADAAEYVSFAVSAQNQPSLTMLGQGVSASAVLDQGVADYCVKRMGGTFCNVDEKCSGRLLDYYGGAQCCVGACLPYSAEEFGNTPEYVAAAKEGVEAISDQQLASLYPVPVVPPVEVPDDRFEDSGPPDSMADDPATVKEQVTEQVTEAVAAVAENVDPIKVAFVVLGVLLVLFLVLLVFRRVAKKEVPVAQGQPDLQQTIGGLVGKGYSYEQIRTYLIGRGFDPGLVSQEIRKHYDSHASERQR